MDLYGLYGFARICFKAKGEATSGMKCYMCKHDTDYGMLTDGIWCCFGCLGKLKGVAT